MQPREYPAKPKKVYFFGTCLVDSVFPGAGLAAIRMLRREGLTVIFPREQSCCGQPAYNAGFTDEARVVARKQVRLFPEPVPIVVPSGSCAGMMRHHWPSLFEGDPLQAAVADIAGRIFEWSEFMVHVLDLHPEDRGDPLTVSWHSSCHARREMHVTEDSKDLIRRLKNVSLVELEREEECCGFGGVFSIKQPDLSGAMVRDKVDDIVRTGAPRVIMGDCGCMMNVAGAMERRDIRVKCQHIAEFLWERTHV